MNKRYRKSKVHPTASVVSEQLLSFLPAAILALTSALTQSDREILAYLVSCSSASFSSINRKGIQNSSDVRGGSKGREDHPPCFNCNCFRCYMSYWAKWDNSPNRRLIHDIIDAFEESLLKRNRKEKNKGRKKGKNFKMNGSAGLLDGREASLTVAPETDLDYGEPGVAADGGAGEPSRGCFGDEGIDEMEEGSFRRFVSFLGERIWKVWG